MEKIKLEDLLNSLKGDHLIYVIDEKFNYEYFGRVSGYINWWKTERDVEVIVESMKYINEKDLTKNLSKVGFKSYDVYINDRENIKPCILKYEKVIVISYSY